MAVPRLDGIASRHQQSFGVESAARLGHTLLEAGISEGRDWSSGEQNPLVFVEKTLHRWATNHGANEIGMEFDVALALVSDLDPYAEERSAAARIERMYLVLEPETAGYVVLGPALRRLESVHATTSNVPSTVFGGA